MGIDSSLETAFQLAEKEKFKDAIAVCSEVIKKNESSYKAYNKRAHIYARMGEWDKALNDIEKTIELNPQEPAHYFSRARWLINTEKYQDAIIDLTKVIELEKDNKDYYYLESTYFLRSYAFHQVGEFDFAIKDLSRVRHDFSLFFSGRIQSKKELLRTCKMRR